MNKKLIIFTDGGARGNPGPAGIGGVLKNEAGENVKEFAEYIGETTNNQAEYKAVVKAIEIAKELRAEELDFYLDSELVVKQLNREYKVKNEGLAPLFVRIYNASQEFKKVTYTHVTRDKDKEADALANQAMDQGY